MTKLKNFEEAAVAVDEMFNSVAQPSGGESDENAHLKIWTHQIIGQVVDGEDSGEDSDDDGDGDERRTAEDDEDEYQVAQESPVRIFDIPVYSSLISKQTDERPSSPDALVLLNTSGEHMGPTDEDDSEFAKELAKMVTESSAEARKVDKRTAQALWESAVLPTGLRKKALDGSDDDEDVSDVHDSDGQGTMKFVMLTKKGNKQQVRLKCGLEL